MKSAKIFNIFTFLLAFAFQVSAQDEKPTIVWKNLQESYQDFADVKPKIKNISDKSVYLYPEFDSDDVLFFDNETNEWTISKFIIGCGNSPNLRFSKSLKLKPNQSIDLSERLDWDFLLLGPFFSGALKDKDKVDWKSVRYFKQEKKYKLRIFYSEQKNKSVKELVSPEFWVKPIN